MAGRYVIEEETPAPAQSTPSPKGGGRFVIEDDAPAAVAPRQVTVQPAPTRQMLQQSIIPGAMPGAEDVNLGDTSRNIIAPGLQGAQNLAMAPRKPEPLPTYTQPGVLEAQAAAVHSGPLRRAGQALEESRQILSAAPTTTKAPSAGQRAMEFMKQPVKELAGMGENLAHQASNIASMSMAAPVVIGNTLGELVTAAVEERSPSWDNISGNIQGQMGGMVYKPVTESGQRQVETTSQAMSAIPNLVDALDSKDSFKKNYPNAYAATQVAGEFAPWIVAGKMLHGASEKPAKRTTAEQADYDAFMQTYSAATGVRDVSVEFEAAVSEYNRAKESGDPISTRLAEQALVDLHKKNQAYNETIKAFSERFKQSPPTKVQLQQAITAMRKKMAEGEQPDVTETSARDVTGQKAIEGTVPTEPVQATAQRRPMAATEPLQIEQKPGQTPEEPALEDLKSKIAGKRFVIEDEEEVKDVPNVETNPDTPVLNNSDGKTGNEKPVVPAAKPKPAKGAKLDQKPREGSDTAPKAPDTVSGEAPATALRPTIRYGSDTVIGQAGSTHADVLDANPDIGEKHELGYVGADGEFLTVEEAKGKELSVRIKSVTDAATKAGEVDKLGYPTGKHLDEYRDLVEQINAHATSTTSVKTSEIPSHVVNAVDAPREVPQSVSLATKQQTKDTLNKNLKNGGIPHSNPIRMTTVEELHDILNTGKLREGEDFEGRSGISAQLVDGKKPIVAYGPNDKISAAIIFPDGSSLGKGGQPNEVKVDSKTDVKELRFVIDGHKELMTFDELKKAVGDKSVKDPWQMTRKEYTDSLGMDTKFSPPQPKREAARFVRLSEDNVVQTGEHGAAVHKALSEGKTVPPEVLAEYPELTGATDVKKGGDTNGKGTQETSTAEETNGWRQEGLLTTKEGAAPAAPVTSETERLKSLDGAYDSQVARYSGLGKDNIPTKEQVAERIKSGKGLVGDKTATIQDIIDEMADGTGTPNERWERPETTTKPANTLAPEQDKKSLEVKSTPATSTPPDTPVIVQPADPPRAFTINPRALEKFNAAFESKDTKALKDILHLENRGLRTEFEKRTGVKLKRTVRETDAAVEEWGNRRDGYGTGKNATERLQEATTKTPTYKAAEKGPKAWSQVARIKDGVINVSGKLNVRPHELYPDTPDHSFQIPQEEWEKTAKSTGPYHAQLITMEKYSPLDNLEPAHGRIREAQIRAVNAAMKKMANEGTPAETPAPPAVKGRDSLPFELTPQIDGKIEPHGYLSDLLHEFGHKGRVTDDTAGEYYDYYTVTVDNDAETEAFIERVEGAGAGFRLEDSTYGKNDSTLVFEFPKEKPAVEKPATEPAKLENSGKIEAKDKEVQNGQNGPEASPAERRSEVQDLGENGVPQAVGESNADGKSETNADAGVLETAPTGDVGEPAKDGSDKGTGSRTGRKVRGGNKEKPAGGDVLDGREGTGRTGLADSGSGGPGRTPGERASGGVRPEPNLGRVNYHIADPEALIGGTPKVRFKKNREAIEAFLSIQAEGRTPTPEELDAMAAYTGWGSFGQELFNGSFDYPRPKPEWEKESQWLQGHLGKENWQAAQSSIINAHYTAPPIVQTMWDIVKTMGFNGGRILEPSIGIGNFFGIMPPDVMNRSRLAGIELDKLTGGMAKILYPEANIQIKGYQESQTADGFYDLVIGNWPFAKDGPADRRYRALNPSLHDYFFLKALDQTRAGGFVIGVTSSGTMDKIGKLTRMELAKKGELVAAFRLPSGTFEKYAGTSVVTDILIFKKRPAPLADPSGEGWMTVSEREMKNGTINTNEYWAAHPDNILGEMDFGHGTTRGRAGMIVDRPENLSELLANLVNKVPKGIYNERSQTQKVISYITNNTRDRQQSVTIGEDGKLFVVQGEYLAPLEEVKPYAVKSAKETRTRAGQITALVEMRKAYGDLIDAERSGENADALRKVLSDRYEAFLKAHGNINGSVGLDILRRVGDPFYSSLAALEVPTPDGGYRPATILSESTVRGQSSIENPSIQDAYVLARNESMYINLDRVATLTGRPAEEVTRELLDTGAIYHTPAGHYEVSDQYLSGNVRRKLREAQAAQTDGADMTRNIEELKKILPPDQPYFKIEAKLGAPWVSRENYGSFVADLLGESSSDGIDISFHPGAWKVKFTQDRLNHKPEARTIWGVDRYPFNKLMQSAMNNSAVTIWGRDEDGNKVVDTEATSKANEKVGALREEFSTWVWKDAGRKISLEKEYNEVMNCTADTSFDGSFLTFPGMALTRGSSEFSLRKHQSDAVWRGLLNKGGLYAHEVGTGKTFTIAGLAVESRRYGIAKKPLVFAHNANSATVAREANEMYPGAKILYVDNLAPDKITTTMRQIANDDWDMVVVPHSLISRFGLTRDTLDALAAEEIEAMEQEAMEAAQDDDIELTREMMDDEDAMKKVRSVTAKQLVHARNRIIKKIDDMVMTATKENAIPFEELGVDMIIVDEAHEFKKPPITTKMRMKGLNTATSGQSLSLHLLSGYVKSLNAGKGVHLFTGTPVTNTLTEIYHMMRYVMDDEMERNGIKAWDSWFNTFADSVSDVELTAAADYESVTRLAAIVNVPELRRMAGQYTDIVFADDMPEFKPRATSTGKTMAAKDLTDAEREELINGRSEKPLGRPYKKIIVDVSPMGEHQKAVLEHLVALSKMFRDASKKERREMMLSGHPASPVLVETAAANAGMDVRLFDKDMADEPGSKVNKCIKNVLDIYNGHDKTSQVIFMERGFSDKSTSTKTMKDGTKVKTTKERFNLAKDLVDKLVKGGIPREQISVIDGSTSKEKRKQNADAMNNGTIRVTIGNTKTLGVGVNMQENLRAIHHLDAPWMPGELEQRNGRGWRQGNKWNTLQEIRYVTEKLDGRRWQVLVVKDRFIKAYLKAKDDIRVIDGDAVNADEEGMGDLTETLSEAAGDPRILLREKYKKDIEKLQNRERTHAYGIKDAEETATRTEGEIADTNRRLDLLDKVIEHYDAKKETFSAKIGNKTFTDRAKAQDALDDTVENLEKKGSVIIGSVYGFDIEIHWNFFKQEYDARLVLPSVEATVDKKLPAWKQGADLAFLTDSLKAKPSFRSMEGILRNLAKHRADSAEKILSKEQSVKALRASAKEPFPRAADLAKKQQMLADIMLDMDNNPVPPPSWLRHGAPVGGEVHYEGKTYPVAGHKWDNEGYFVTIEKEGHTENIPYMEATDENGMPVYEEHEFEPPVVATATPATGRPAAPTAGQTLDSLGFQQAYEALTGMARYTAKALPHLADIGRKAYSEGADRYTTWKQRMKDLLGKLWDRFKSAMETVWSKVVEMNRKLGERGAVGSDLKEAARRERELKTRHNQFLDRALEAVNNKNEAAALRWMARAEEIEEMLRPAGPVIDIPIQEVEGGDTNRPVNRGEGTKPESGGPLQGRVNPVSDVNDRAGTEPAGAISNASETTGIGTDQAAHETPPAKVQSDVPGGGNDDGAAPGDEQRTTGIKNAVTEEERDTSGRSPVEVETRRSFPDAFDNGKRMVDSGEIDPRLLAAAMREKPRALSAEESVALIYDRMRLQNDHVTVMGQIEEATKTGDKVLEVEARQRLAKIEDDINTNDYAARRTGYEQGLGLAARKMMIAEDYSLARSIQRMRVATGLPEIPEEIRAKLEDLTKQLNDALATSAKYEEKIKDLEAARKVARIRDEVSPVRKPRAKKPAERTTLDTEFHSLATRFRSLAGRLAMNIDPEMAIVLGEMARNRIIAGVHDVRTIIDNIYEDLADIPDLEKRDIRDAISNYGHTYKLSQDEIETEMREIRRQMRLISALEDAENKTLPLHSGLQRDPVSDEVRDLQKQVKQAMREAGIDSQSARSPEQQWKTSLDAAKTRLKNLIHDLNEQIRTGKKTPKKIGFNYDAEAKALKAEADRLREALQQIEGKPGLSDEQRVKIATNAVEKSIAEYTRRLKEHDLKPKPKGTPAPETPELKRLRARRDALAESFKQMKRELQPPKDPMEAALKAYKTRTAKRLADMQEQLDTGNFEKKARRVLKMDPEAMRLKNQVERMKERIDTEIFKQKQAARTVPEKVLDWAVKWRRAVILSGVQTIGKLTAAATMRQITTPLEEIIGAGLYRLPVFSRIAAKAPREGGGFNVRAQAEAYAQWFKKRSWEDFKDVATTGRGELDRLYGHKRDLPPEAIEFFGRMHGALKNTPKRAEFFLSLQKITEWHMANGYDMSDPVNQATVAAQAYIEANRAIFMNDNFVVKGYRIMLRYFQSQGIGGHTLATGMQMVMPIIKIPTNFAAEVTSLAFGGIKGSATLAFAKGIENLTPEQADYVMRAFKKQGLGIALLILGYLGAAAGWIGGYYERGEKRKYGEPKAGDIGKIPHWALHTPALEVLQVGATLYRVKEHYAGWNATNEAKPADKQKPPKTGATSAAMFAATKGIFESVPFLDTPVRMGEAFKTYEGAGKWMGQFAESLIMPPTLRQWAKATDKAGDEQIPREQNTLGQILLGDIPGQRGKLPVNMTQVKRMNLGNLADIIDSAPADVTEQIMPEFRKKFIKQAGELSEDERSRYKQIIEDNR